MTDNRHDDLDTILDLDDDAEIEMPESFAEEARPKKPWLLLGASVVAIALASYIIIRVAGHQNDNAVTISLDVPALVADEVDTIVIPPQADAPVRVVEDRPAATFNAAAPAVEAPRPRPVTPATTPPPAPAPATTPPPPPPAAATGIMAQIGSYATRTAAQTAQRNHQTRHPELFANRQFVILAAQVSGREVHRLRVVNFANVDAARQFCARATTAGIGCYVTR